MTTSLNFGQPREENSRQEKLGKTCNAKESHCHYQVGTIGINTRQFANARNEGSALKLTIASAAVGWEEVGRIFRCLTELWDHQCTLKDVQLWGRDEAV